MSRLLSRPAPSPMWWTFISRPRISFAPIWPAPRWTQAGTWSFSPATPSRTNIRPVWPALSRRVRDSEPDPVVDHRLLPRRQPVQAAGPKRRLRLAPAQLGIGASVHLVQRHLARPRLCHAATAAQILEDGAQAVKVRHHGRSCRSQRVKTVPFRYHHETPLSRADQPDIAPAGQRLEIEILVQADEFLHHARFDPHMHHIHRRHDPPPYGQKLPQDNMFLSESRGRCSA